MKISIKYLMLLAAVSFTAFAAHAQRGEVKLNAAYAYSIPAGSFANTVTENSPRGWNAGISYFATDQLSVGAEVGFRDFYEKVPRKLYTTNSGSDISAVMTHSAQAMPILAKVQYQFLPGKTVQPFVAVGAGANFVAYHQYLGEFDNSFSKVKFAAVPEAGINVPFGRMKAAGISLSAFYGYMPFNEAGIENLNHYGAKLGLSIPLRN